MRRDKPSEQYEYEKNAEYLTFKPKINKRKRHSQGNYSASKSPKKSEGRPEFKTSGINVSSSQSRKYFGGTDGSSIVPSKSQKLKTLNSPKKPA